MSSRNWLRLSWFLTVGITIWAAANINYGKKHYQNIVKADGRGYYAHLPAIFIYHDLSFSFFDTLDAKKYYDPNLYYDYRSIIDGDTVNKYYAGTALPMTPFFLGAHWLSRMSDEYHADGYSKYYQISVSLAALFFMACTLLLWIKILRRHKIPDSWIAFVLPLMVFGTHWFYYVISEPSMSHVYSVFFISALVWSLMKWDRGKGKTMWLWLFAFLLGLITVIRPVNGLSGLFLLVYTRPKDIADLVLQPLKWLPGVLFFILPLTFQLIIYKIQTGSFWVYSYQEEGFNFADPQWLNMLFSYKKGLFVYTPALFLALIGYVFWIAKQKWEGVTSLIFLVFITYVLSSWWNWQYGGSFSSRVFVDYLVLFVVPLAYLLNSAKRTFVKWGMISLFFLITLLCQFQTYQYRYGVIHWEDMNKEKYWDVFLNTEFIREKKK